MDAPDETPAAAAATAADGVDLLTKASSESDAIDADQVVSTDSDETEEDGDEAEDSDEADSDAESDCDDDDDDDDDSIHSIIAEDMTYFPEALKMHLAYRVVTFCDDLDGQNLLHSGVLGPRFRPKGEAVSCDCDDCVLQRKRAALSRPPKCPCGDCASRWGLERRTLAVELQERQVRKCDCANCRAKLERLRSELRATRTKMGIAADGAAKTRVKRPAEANDTCRTPAATEMSIGVDLEQQRKDLEKENPMPAGACDLIDGMKREGQEKAPKMPAAAAEISEGAEEATKTEHATAAPTTMNELTQKLQFASFEPTVTTMNQLPAKLKFAAFEPTAIVDASALVGGTEKNETEKEDKNSIPAYMMLNRSGINTANNATAAGSQQKPVKSEDVYPDRQRITLQSSVAVTDPDTLLARLNTRRLCKRLNDPDPDCPTYALDKNTDEIAAEEWYDLMQRAREQKTFAIPPKHELLMFTPIKQDVAILASYPRSGNSLMRTLYERITLRVSGSDMRGGLVQHDLVGEAAVSQKQVQFVKTHYPERRGVPAFRASRVVLLVRNPYDAIDSYFNLMMTGTHTTSVSEEQRERNKKIFETMALKEIQVWRDFHEYWLAQEVPMLLVRYEDLVRDPELVMSRVVRHALEVDHMGFFHQRIRHALREERIEKLGSYKPRSGGIGKSLKKYSPELLAKLNVGIVSTMEKLGYSDLLTMNKETFDDLEPLPYYGREIFNGDDVVNVNKGKLVRTQELQTNWEQVKKQMGVTSGKCDCPRCQAKGLN